MNDRNSGGRREAAAGTRRRVPRSTPTPAAPGPRRARAPAAAERYVLEREIARGGMGRILAARDLRLGRDGRDQGAAHAGRRARGPLRARGALTARLQHPAIVPVYEAGRWPSGEPFYAMKLVAGRVARRARSRDADDARRRGSRCCRT